MLSFEYMLVKLLWEARPKYTSVSESFIIEGVPLLHHIVQGLLRDVFFQNKIINVNIQLYKLFLLE